MVRCQFARHKYFDNRVITLQLAVWACSTTGATSVFWCPQLLLRWSVAAWEATVKLRRTYPRGKEETDPGQIRTPTLRERPPSVAALSRLDECRDRVLTGNCGRGIAFVRVRKKLLQVM